MAACHLGAPDPDAAGARGRAPTHPLLPFVLIQGPPGTGKTHTVKARGEGGERWVRLRCSWALLLFTRQWAAASSPPPTALPNHHPTTHPPPLPPQGMLNTWHLVAYQRYYDGLIAATAPPPGHQPPRPAPGPGAAGGGSGSVVGDAIASTMLSDLGRAVAQVCTKCWVGGWACQDLGVGASWGPPCCPTWGGRWRRCGAMLGALAVGGPGGMLLPGRTAGVASLPLACAHPLHPPLLPGLLHPPPPAPADQAPHPHLHPLQRRLRRAADPRHDRRLRGRQR